MNAPPMVDYGPALQILLFGAALALGPLAWVLWRQRGERAVGSGGWMRALTWATLFLTFDLVLFGAFTRLTDSGLGCPDWPGCYGNASPLGAHEEIRAAQSVLPEGPVTHRKAWIEMTHRYLATGVGALITVLAASAWWQARQRRMGVSPWWPTATLVWVCLQGAFGALTVTMKLYPAIVTAHLLGGLGLLVLLAVQTQLPRRVPLLLPGRLHAGLVAVTALAVLQSALGGWVSTNYAVLACTDFPTCHGSLWPAMDFARGFALFRELGMAHDGGPLSLDALTAIHYVHRLVAYVLLASLAVLAWRLWATDDAELRRWSARLAAVAAWQLATGLSNVVLGWPLPAAVAHTGGAAALLTLLAMLLTRAAAAQRAPIPGPGRTPARARVAS